MDDIEPNEPYPAEVAATTDAATSVAPRRRRRGLMVGLVAGGVAVLLAAGGGGVALGLSLSASNTTASSPTATAPGSSGSSGGSATAPFGQRGSSQSGSVPSSATAATAAQKVGVVTIVSSIDYSSTEQSAGTGIILTSTGEILTNNHVIAGATSIQVTDETTNKSYAAKVVGTDSTDDIAVLQLSEASGLTTVSTDSSTALAVNDAVTDVGNAEGTGNLVAAVGTVAALDQDITVANEYTGGSESLSGLIEVDADVVSGDSGGPLLGSNGHVVGIVTAASSGTSDVTGYAITIGKALSIAKQIESGVSTANITIGYPAFLGVQIASAQGTQAATGVQLGGVIAGMPAAAAGLAAGDVITAVDGTAVSTAAALSSAVQAHTPGDSVSISYTDSSGTAKTATVTLVTGPAA